MSVLVMIYGQSGTGKSTSLRNFSRDDVAIVNVSGKPLPFRNNLKTYKSDNYQAIMKAIQAAPQKSIVIDDATYLMVNEFMRTAKQTGYQKYTDMACSLNSLIEFAASFPDDKVVYFMGKAAPKSQAVCAISAVTMRRLSMCPESRYRSATI